VKANMAGWHRVLYAAGGAGLLVWGWGSILATAGGVILLIEAAVGRCPGCAALGCSTKKTGG
jgi:hypothetical protein